MHQCLQCNDIIWMIFECTEDNYLHPRIKTLASLARTCRRFQGPALDQLWRTQDGLIPLLRCLPPDKWELSGSGKFHLRSVIHSSDWKRVLLYSCRIRELYMGRHVTLDVLELLSVASPPDFLQNLRVLRWHLDGPSFPYIRLFLRPSLTTISLAQTDSLTHLHILSYLGSACPSLLDVEVFANDASRTPQLFDAVSSFILDLTGVQKLRVPHIQFSTCRHLAGLPSLLELSVDSIQQDFPLTMSATTAGIRFSSLQRLDLVFTQLPAATNFIRTLSQTPLRNLEFRRTGTTIPTPDAVGDFCQTLRTSCSHGRLTSIELRLDGSWNGNPPSILSDRLTIRPTHLDPLLAFASLRDVTLQWPLAICLDDEFMIALSMAWPRIQDLKLPRHCPELARLTMDIDATVRVESAQHDTEGDRVVQTALTFLNVRYSRIDSPLEVATFLSGVFPSVTTLFAEQPDPNGDARFDMWMEVEKLIPMFASVRSDERKHWIAPSEPSQ
ncbi:hypothetical protein C8R43DRAFT_1195012 [Mycena crocata]|nr:hypothetical protein C8R43DRAFT_1195012 [Mycena crocata]